MHVVPWPIEVVTGLASSSRPRLLSLFLLSLLLGSPHEPRFGLVVVDPLSFVADFEAADFLIGWCDSLMLCRFGTGVLRSSSIDVGIEGLMPADLWLNDGLELKNEAALMRKLIQVDWPFENNGLRGAGLFGLCCSWMILVVVLAFSLAGVASGFFVSEGTSLRLKT
ncbi:hypothetical protein Nepgr_023104 [Nepenthes gracilis]|uniref:Uncharacterized protein n=1 Tax=Nepenthes gracilis TaxID=150966 RepID=A0AAD3T200_NEPGR|nr:hypothetical protein Nepgr_023104 [Nepenthes gracilis]